MLYLIIKSIHVIAIISWMAGLLYLPRIFVYHTENLDNGQMSDIFMVMEKRLLKIIMNPSMVISVLFGVALFYIVGIGIFSSYWFLIKLFCILGLVIIHFRLIMHWKLFERRESSYSSRYFRILNEVPAVLMIIIVFMVIVKPGG